MLLISLLKTEIIKYNSPIVLLPFQHSNKKPLFGRLDIEKGLNHIIPLLYLFEEPLPINDAVRLIVSKNFKKLKYSLQVSLVVVAEQIAMDLPVNNLILICEKLKICKVLNVIAKLANVEVLFSQYDPVFTQETLISLIVLPGKKGFSLGTTRIERKKPGGLSGPDISKFISTIDHFISMFFSIFKTPEGFSKVFSLSLTRFLIVFGYSLHISNLGSLHNSFLKVLQSFQGYYDYSQLNLAAVSLRSCRFLSVLYEFKCDWVHLVRSKLLLKENSPISIMDEYLPKASEEHSKGQIIHSCLKFALKSGFSREDFLAKTISHSPLLNYIVKHY